MKAALAEDPRGLKRVCPNCGNHYYDLNKRPITCPSCEVEFSTEAKIKSRRSRSANDIGSSSKENEDAMEEDELLEEDGDEDIVSLDDIEEDSDDLPEDDDDMDLDDDEDMDLDDDDLGAGIDDMDDDEEDIDDVSMDDDEDR